ncbi:MAG: glycosyltransferase family 4 protein [Verrucomicrobiota bacterium]
MTTAAPHSPKLDHLSLHGGGLPRLAVVLSHPVQYYAPWFAEIAESGFVDLRVFYLWDPDKTGNMDRKFGGRVEWDIPLLRGYSSEFVENASSDAGTHHFAGLDNPTVIDRLHNWRPNAILLFGYAWKTHCRIALSPTLRKIPLLFRGDSHELFSPPPSIRRWFSQTMRRILFRRFSGFLSVGTAHDEYLRKAGVPTRKLFRCPHAVDNARFQSSTNDAEREASCWKATLGIEPERPVALFAGKFEPKKRPQDLLKAFLSLDLSTFEKKPALLFVGSGKLENDLHEIAAESIGRDVFFAPFQNQTLMPRTYASGDFLVLPSLGRGETWGLAVNECMNLGRTALVSTHVGCGPDLIEEGTTGWQFEAGNVDDLREKLFVAFSDLSQTRRMGRAARMQMQSFSYEEATKGLKQSLRKILSLRDA